MIITFCPVVDALGRSFIHLKEHVYLDLQFPKEKILFGIFCNKGFTSQIFCFLSK